MPVQFALWGRAAALHTARPHIHTGIRDKVPPPRSDSPRYITMCRAPSGGQESSGEDGGKGMEETDGPFRIWRGKKGGKRELSGGQGRARSRAWWHSGEDEHRGHHHPACREVPRPPAPLWVPRYCRGGEHPRSSGGRQPPPCHAGAAPAAAPLPGTRWPGCAWSTELHPPPPATHKRIKPRHPHLGITCSCPETPPQNNPSQRSPPQSPPHTHAASKGLQPGHQLLHWLPKGFQHRARLVHGEGLAVPAVQGGRAGGVPVLRALAGGWGGVRGHRLLPDLRVL